MKTYRSRQVSILNARLLPHCAGPKLHAFEHRRSPIKWLDRVDGHDDEEDGGQAYVFKVEIKRKVYALKVFKFVHSGELCGAVESRTLTTYSVDEILQHLDPFFAECRAYGRILEEQRSGRLGKAIAVPCLGFLTLSKADVDELTRRGIDVWSDIGGDATAEDRQRHAPRAIVKEFVQGDTGVTPRKMQSILRRIRRLNRIKVYNGDIKPDNFINGLMVDFGSAKTEPFCVFETMDARMADGWRKVDLVCFDDMVRMSRIATRVRAMPNWDYCRKLRSSGGRTIGGLK